MPTPEEVMLWQHQQVVKAKSKRANYAYAPRRVDDNHKALVKAMRQLGLQVFDIHEGTLDTIVAYKWLNVPVEIKNGSKPPSGRRFTEKQEKFFKHWRGLKAVVCNVDDCFRLSERMKSIVGAIDYTPSVIGSLDPQYIL